MQPLADQGNQANQLMVDRLIAEGALWSAPLIAAFRATPRHCFLDRVFQFSRKHNGWRAVRTEGATPEVLRLLYSDRALITHLSRANPHATPLPISSSSQPSLMAQMLEDLKLTPGLRTLEIGAGTGYNAALLAHVVGPGQLVSIDVDRRVLAEAREHLQTFADRQVQVQHADGRSGFAEAAPYDRLIVTAASDDLEPAWLEQMADRGLLLAPWSLAPGLAYIVRGSVTEGIFHGRLTRAAYFMPLRAEDEAGQQDLDALPPAGAMDSLPAPWSGWFERRRQRLSWIGFSQALGFYGWLRGLQVHYRTTDRGQAVFGFSLAGSSDLCWLGPGEWLVSGESGRNLGWSLWRAFLDAGGPWPTEFKVKVSPQGGLQPGRREGYLRQGPRCQQLWELTEPRDRPTWF